MNGSQKNTHEKHKVVAFVILVIFCVCAGFCSYIIWHGQNDITTRISVSEENVRNIVNISEKNYSDKYKSRINSFLNIKASPSREKILKAFKYQDREELFQLSEPYLKLFMKEDAYFVTFAWFLPDNHAFLRVHQPKLFDDDISVIRPDIVGANKDLQQKFGYMAGYAGLSYRIVQPVVYRGRHLGGVQFGLTDSFLIDMLQKQLGIVVIQVIPTKTFRKIKFSKLPSYSYGSFTAQSHDHDIDLIKSASSAIDWTLDRQRTVIQGKDYVISKVFELSNYAGKPEGWLFALTDISELTIGMRTDVIKIISTSIILLLLSSFIISKSYNKLIDKITQLNDTLVQKNISLEDQVVERTKMLTETNRALTTEMEEHKQAEEEKQNLETRLLQSQKMEAIGTLAGGIAHDFNNILAVILGYIEMAQEDAPPGTQYQKDLEKVLAAANRAKDLVKQILSFSHQAQVDRMPMEIQPLIKEALKMLRSSIPATISITENIDPNSETVLANPTQIHQILMNLCTNAFHAMEATGGALSVSVKTAFVDKCDKKMLLHVTPGEYVELTVSDTGSGIGPDVIGRIFDPYFTTKKIGKGTGMGLAIVHGIIKEYGGEITVESQLGKGTTFHVYFPVIQKDAIPEIKESEEFPTGKERILFIDDEELLAEMGKDMLERLGYHVTVRRSSIEALATFQNTPQEFDMVITDQTMPDMTGADLARRMMQIRPDIPIILCTGYSNLIDEDSAKGLGIKEFALKPLTKGGIAKLIRKVLHGKVDA